MRISKEKVIVLTSYERRSLFRFLALYLVSVFVLLAIIGYLFFENSKASIMSAMKFEMMYQARMLSSQVSMKAMKNREQNIKNFDTITFLKTLNHCRFPVGYYSDSKKPLYTEIEHVKQFDTDFFVHDKQCYTIEEDTNEHLGIRYIVLKENELVDVFYNLRLTIIGYLLLSFLLMGIVGYFLSRLFLRPVREQIESLDRFISDTTHELNTPISAILMTVQSLKNIEPKKLQRLEASAKRLSSMYSSLTYRLEGGVEIVEVFCLAKVLEERLEFIKELIEAKHLSLSLQIEPTDVKLSKHAAYRLIDNLLSNAIKYSNVRDTIYITLTKRILRVKDEGIGIDTKLQADIFRRYYRANSERGGFGIGLNIVLSICKEYNIKLALESTEGEGSTFILTFPNVE